MWVHLSLQQRFISQGYAGLLVCNDFRHLFGSTTLKSCKNSEAEHVLLVVPISTGIASSLQVNLELVIKKQVLGAHNHCQNVRQVPATLCIGLMK